MLLREIELASKLELFLEQQRSAGMHRDKTLSDIFHNCRLDGCLTLYRDETLYVFVIPCVCPSWCASLLQLHL